MKDAWKHEFQVKQCMYRTAWKNERGSSSGPIDFEGFHKYLAIPKPQHWARTDVARISKKSEWLDGFLYPTTKTMHSANFEKDQNNKTMPGENTTVSWALVG
jgi:hypothetical protein